MARKHKTTPVLPPRRTPPARRAKLSITLDPVVLREVAEREDRAWAIERSTVISRDLHRYYRLLAHARARLREQLAPGEIRLLCDALNGTVISDDLAGSLWAEAEDACRLDRLDEKWEVDRDHLIPLLREMDPLLLLALADAIQRFWIAVGKGKADRDPAHALD